MILDNKYEITHKINNGTNSFVFKAIIIKTNENVVIKYEKKNNNGHSLRNEIKIVSLLQNIKGIPKLLNYKLDDSLSYIAYEMLGNNLNYYVDNNNIMSNKNIAIFAIKSIELLKNIHTKNILHRDLNLNNFILDQNSKDLYLIDYGLAKSYIYCVHCNKNKQQTKNIIGTLLFCSSHVHNGKEYSKRDDLISLGYIFAYLQLGTLPWKNNKNIQSIKYMKNNIKSYLYNKNLLKEIKIYLEYCLNLEINQIPDYNILISLFKNSIKETDKFEFEFENNIYNNYIKT
jgi:serine/threonine protein kinase